MRSLSCRRNSRNLALFVADDLPPAKARNVAAHLRDCGACREQADSLVANRDLVKAAHALPEFNSEFYAQLRRSVLSEVVVNSALPRSLFSWRWAYAAVAVVALVASGFVLQHLNSITSERSQELAFMRPATKRIVAISSDEGAPQQPNTYKRRLRHKSVGRNTIQAERNGVETLAATTLTERAPASEVSRIEIQTSNPNIRIIWLTSNDPVESQPPNATKDETRDRE